MPLKQFQLAYLTSTPTLASYLLVYRRNLDVATGKNPGAVVHINTLRTGDADLRFYITTVQDG